MKKILCVVAVLCVVASVGYCQEKTSTLQLTISSDKAAYKTGEEITLQILVSNPSSDPAIFNSRGLQISLRITEAEGEKVNGREVKVKRGLPEDSDFVTLDGGQSWDFGPIVVSPYSSKGWWQYPYLERAYDLKKPGVYTIRAIYENADRESLNYRTGKRKMVDAWTGTLTSKTLTIEVVEKEARKQTKGLGS